MSPSHLTWASTIMLYDTLHHQQNLRAEKHLSWWLVFRWAGPLRPHFICTAKVLTRTCPPIYHSTHF